MTIQVGDSIPDVNLKVLGEQGPADVSTSEIFSGKKVVMFAVPGAFTPTCSAAHLPGYVANADKIKAKGIDAIVCVSVNDPFVMDAWGKGQNAEEITMLGDPAGDLASAMGTELDGTGFGLGKRSSRYSLVAEDGKITVLNLEQGGAFEVSSAEAILDAL
ncbi:MAG: peroxiredoxin [Gammaproteobacteria bacterium]|mgnify:CR=1 FL=1|jgi:glutaredoxin/glutathione-dependent peroxiredoxin|nr:peroxiredoxin [Gammaproteobacteria bacterium]MBT7369965.1 peroxiredoxin [Gammaproteobacteria bacterium]